ncbi:MAG TPA: molecular chaperone TorD family protein [bacterium]|nr:molecular chaperone TorD family protein [bacterium]
MTLLSEPDTAQFRSGYYDLLARLFASEPDERLLHVLREGLDDRTVGATQVHPAMGEGWRTMAAHLDGDVLEDLTDEFTRVFVGPFGPVVNAFESFYLTGRLYGQPLVDVRSFMGRQSLESAGGEHREPEDALAFELGIMARLVGRQLAGGDADPASLIEPQREFLAGHLLVWAPACLADIEGTPGAAFYRGAALVLRGFLEVERDFFSEEGGLEVEDLEAARRRYRAPEFRGPIFDAEPPSADNPSGKPKDDA